MQIGISTSCYYPRPTEESLDTLLKAGVRTLEVFFNTHSELDITYVKELRRRVDEAGARVVSIHPYTSGMEGLLFFSEYGRRFDDARQYYKKYYQAANILNAGLVVFHGGFRHQTIPVEEYAARMEVLDGDASSAGVYLAQENVERNRSRDPSFLHQLRCLRPAQKFVLDLKQAVRAGYDPVMVADAMGPNMIHLHLSDHAPYHDCLPPGVGSMDFEKLFCRLKKWHFDGTAVVELYRKDFETQCQLDKSLHFLQNITESL